MDNRRFEEIKKKAIELIKKMDSPSLRFPFRSSPAITIGDITGPQPDGYTTQVLTAKNGDEFSGLSNRLLEMGVSGKDFDSFNDVVAFQNKLREELMTDFSETSDNRETFRP